MNKQEYQKNDIKEKSDIMNTINKNDLEILKNETTSESLDASLASNLSNLSKSKISTLLHNYNLPQEESMETLERNILDPEIMRTNFIYMDENLHFIFHEILNAPKEIFGFSDLYEGNYLVCMGYLYISCVEGKFYFHVPKEIKEVFDSFYQEDISAEIQRINLLYRCAVSAVHLYGALPVADLLSLIQKHGVVETTEDELIKIVQIYLTEENEVYYEDDLFYSATFEFTTGMEGVYELRKQQVNQSRYMPGQEELLKYYDAYYSRMIPEYRALKDFFAQAITEIDEEEKNEFLDSFMKELCYSIRFAKQIEETLETINDYELLPYENARADEMLNLLIVADYHSRKWHLNGRTAAAELGVFDKSSLSPNAAGGNEKYSAMEPPSKNSKCFCGSGKKYKRCCGKDAG